MYPNIWIMIILINERERGHSNCDAQTLRLTWPNEQNVTSLDRYYVFDKQYIVAKKEPVVAVAFH